MARLSDVPRVFAAIGVFEFAKRVYTQLVDDNLLTWAAALAYSWLFAVFPFLIFVLSLLPYLPAGSKDRAREEIHQFVQQLPKEAAATVWDNVNKVLDQPKGGWNVAISKVCRV